MLPRLFHIGSYSQATYGVLVALAFLVALSLIARLARRDDEPNKSHCQRDRDGRPAGEAPFAPIDGALALTVEKPKALGARRLAHQSLNNSLMPVLARVCASTVLTMTAQ